MTVNELPVSGGKVTCTDGRLRSTENCRFCIHSRYFVIDGKQERSPSLAFCLRERTVKEVEYLRATAVGCAESRGDGFSCIGNIIA